MSAHFIDLLNKSRKSDKMRVCRAFFAFHNSPLGEILKNKFRCTP